MIKTFCSPVAFKGTLFSKITLHRNHNGKLAYYGGEEHSDDRFKIVFAANSVNLINNTVGDIPLPIILAYLPAI